MFRSVAVFIALVGTFSTFQAKGEAGNSSDVTGSIVTTSDLIRNRVGVKERDLFRPRWIRRLHTIHDKVRLLSKGEALGFPIEVQKNLAHILLRSTDSSIAAHDMALGLMRLLPQSRRAYAYQLMEELHGLTARQDITPRRMVSAVRAYNNLIHSLPIGSLRQPSWELTAIQWALNPIKTAYAPGLKQTFFE